jgi:hypothetical protein
VSDRSSMVMATCSSELIAARYDSTQRVRTMVGWHGGCSVRCGGAEEMEMGDGAEMAEMAEMEEGAIKMTRRGGRGLDCVCPAAGAAACASSPVGLVARSLADSAVAFRFSLSRPLDRLYSAHPIISRPSFDAPSLPSSSCPRASRQANGRQWSPHLGGWGWVPTLLDHLFPPTHCPDSPLRRRRPHRPPHPPSPLLAVVRASSASSSSGCASPPNHRLISVSRTLPK